MITRRTFLAAAAAVAPLPAARAQADPPEAERIRAALPAGPFVPPPRPRKLLIFDLNVGYGGHGSIRTANNAFEAMGRASGAFETVVSRDPSVFAADSLRGFDAVFFNNTVGNLFEDLSLRRNLIAFVYSGGGLMGVHGTSVAFTRWPGAIEDWPEFGRMLGARGASHLTSDERAFITLDDPPHPLNAPFDGRDFEYRDEFFRFQDPYSRNRVRVLFRIDAAKTPMPEGRKPFRADNDYALAWVRRYGRGRVFYCAIAHNPRVFWDSLMLRFYLGACQFALGDLPAPTIPSARLTPAIRAQERLGWNACFENHSISLFDAVDRAAKFGVPYLTASEEQPVGGSIAKAFDARLPDEDLEVIRLKLDAAGVTLLAHRVASLPQDEPGRRAIFAFARRIGAEVVVSDAVPANLDAVDALCSAFDIRLAIDGAPDEVRKACDPRSPRIGALADVGQWMRSGIDPAAGAAALKGRLVAARLPDTASPEPLLREIRRHGGRPPMFFLASAAAVESFNAASLKLTEERSGT